MLILGIVGSARPGVQPGTGLAAIPSRDSNADMRIADPAKGPFPIQIHLSYNARLHPSRPGWVIVRLSPSIDYV